MARAKRESDEIYNARRRAKRQAAYLERDISRGKAADTAQNRAYIETLRKIAQATYIGRNATETTRTSAKNAAGYLRRATAGAKMTASDRRNLIFRANIAQASRTPGGFKGMTQENVKIFFRATQSAWAGKGPDKLKSIMDYYGTNDLQALYRKVMEQNKSALFMAYEQRHPLKGVPTDNKNSALQRALGVGVDTDQGSPDYIVFVTDLVL